MKNIKVTYIRLFLITLFVQYQIQVFSQILIPGSYDKMLNDLTLLRTDSIVQLSYRSKIEYKDANQYINVLPINTMLSFNSAYPRSFNDGPVWQGKGLTYQLNAGIQMKYGLLKATFYPGVYLSQNSEYELANVNPRQNPLNYQFGISQNVDFVQRFGNASFAKAYWGQSEISLGNEKIRMAISSQNFTLGPAKYNSIVLSDAAPGFPHLILGTPEKVNLQLKGKDLGNIEANLFYGLLSESAYFDTISDNDYRYINGLSVAYEIPGIQGFTIGFQRSLFKNTKYFENADLYSMFKIKDNGIVVDAIGDTVLITGNDTFDQLASLSLEWRIPETDMRVYMEFAKNDFNGSERRLLVEIEHSRAYTFGLEKLYSLPKRNLLLGYEHTFLPRYISYQWRPNPPFYTHHIARQGYTHQGQLLGAGIGPGTTSDRADLIFINPRGVFGINFQRRRIDEDYFVMRIPDDTSKEFRHDVEYTLGGIFSRENEKYVYGLQVDLSYRFNMYYEHKNDMVNLYSNLFLRYKLN